MSERKDGQTLFHWILRTTTWGLTNTYALDWHLKAKDKKYYAGLTKNYCLAVSMQKIRSIHKLIHQILGSHQQMTKPIFDWTQPKIIEITFSFPEPAPACKKSVHSINSFLRQSQFQSPATRLATPISHSEIF